MINAILINLDRGVKLLKTINNEDYSDASTPPYYSSIGSHVRHILDVFSCIFDGVESGKIDLSIRERNELAQTNIKYGLIYFNEIINKLKALDSLKFNEIVDVTDDLGNGKITTKYTLASILVQAHSHTIHHYAIIGFIVNGLGIELLDNDFGYNPTTPKKINV